MVQDIKVQVRSLSRQDAGQKPEATGHPVLGSCSLFPNS